MGVVYGDIGTSPLYTMKEAFSPEHGLALTENNILGVVSLIVWMLILVVTLKYVLLVTRANNDGEGGIMALLALALSPFKHGTRRYTVLVLIGLIGTALFFGDGIITPSISVLSAVEGLSIATPALSEYVVPVTVVILLALYMVQRKGTAHIGRWFGPIMVIWFSALAVMGLINIVAQPHILQALNPLHAVMFLPQTGWVGFLALGAVVLAVTGAEALYADMGHFGAKPIRIAWLTMVFPALALSYLGQGALLMAQPSAVANPFYHQLGNWAVYPLVALATTAAIIASQATISGTFSIVRQAIALGYIPRLKVQYTSDEHIGQIYIPFINWLQLVLVLSVVIGFGSSSDLASAYGIAVTTTMLATTCLTFFVIRYKWHINLALCLAVTGLFMFIDLMLVSANMLKIPSGGWFPLLLAAIIIVLMLTWRTGRRLVAANLYKNRIPLEDFLSNLFGHPLTRVPGTAIFFRSEGDGVPHALLHNLSHNKILHERTVFLTVLNRDVPYVHEKYRVSVENLGNGCYQVDMRFGFQEDRDIPKALALCEPYGLEFQMLDTSFYIARQTVIATMGGGMAHWREVLYATLARNARSASDYFSLPANRVIELGAQVEI
ncbi:potassium transporter Kup [Alcaligenaceae bacterium]|nr:potassium transporter Kup [Alcaligenaceae bacterium]